MNRSKQTLIYLGLIALACDAMPAGAETLRVASYNINADTANAVYTGTGGNGSPNGNLLNVLQDIGREPDANLNNATEPLDILALQETLNTVATVSPIVTSLNKTPGANYVAAPAIKSTSGTGNGPNAMIYNANALTLINTSFVNNVGFPRPVGRYEFEPIGGTAANAFYVYVSHMKSSSSGTTADNQNERNAEATAIRADEGTLGANPSVLYVGDYNMDNSLEPAYGTMTAAGMGQAIDPIGPAGLTAWNSGLNTNGILTETAGKLQFRDDVQLMTSNVFNDSSPNGLQYVAGSFHTFGNNGSISARASVTSGGNTAPNLPDRVSVDSDLIQATDHLPVVADYTISVPEPTTFAYFAMTTLLLLRHRRDAGRRRSSKSIRGMPSRFSSLA